MPQENVEIFEQSYRGDILTGIERDGKVPDRVRERAHGDVNTEEQKQ